MNILLARYRKELVPAMIKEFGYKNVHAVPRVTKIVVNTGFGRLINPMKGEAQRKVIDEISEILGLVTGQKPVITHAKKSIASFKLREGQPVGAKITLRGARMYDFLTRLVVVAFARTRDFQGINPASIDKEGNLTFAIKEHTVFPEVPPEKTNLIFGFEVTIVTSAATVAEAVSLFRGLGIPFKRT